MNDRYKGKVVVERKLRKGKTEEDGGQAGTKEGRRRSSMEQGRGN
jgi:hypothetical protein